MCALECAHPLRASARSGVTGWVLEQGKCSRDWGQQLMVYGADRRTVDWKQSRCCSASTSKRRQPESHGPVTLVPQLHRAARWTSSEYIPRAAAPSVAPLLAARSEGRRHAWSGRALVSVGSHTGGKCNTSCATSCVVAVGAPGDWVRVVSDLRVTRQPQSAHQRSSASGGRRVPFTAAIRATWFSGVNTQHSTVSTLYDSN